MKIQVWLGVDRNRATHHTLLIDGKAVLGPEDTTLLTRVAAWEVNTGDELSIAMTRFMAAIGGKLEAIGDLIPCSLCGKLAEWEGGVDERGMKSAVCGAHDLDEDSPAEEEDEPS